MLLEVYKISPRIIVTALFGKYCLKNDNNICMKIIVNQFNYRVLYALIKFIKEYRQFRRNFIKFLLIHSQNELKLFFAKYNLNYNVINYNYKLKICFIADSLIIKDVIIRVWYGKLMAGRQFYLYFLY